MWAIRPYLNQLPAADDFCCAHNKTDGLLDLPWSPLREAVPEARRHAAMGCELHSDKNSSGRESAEYGIETPSALHATSTTESAAYSSFFGEDASMTIFDLSCSAEESVDPAMPFLESTPGNP